LTAGRPVAPVEIPGRLWTRQRLNPGRLITNTCVEATARYAAELGYDVTVVRDATATFSEEAMHAALDINLPNYVNTIVATSEIVEAISASRVLSSDSLVDATG
jgi:isochorismate hydrolase